MFSSPALVTVKQHHNQELINSIPAVLGDLGLNSGNMLFGESLYRTLPNSKKINKNFSSFDIEGRDCIVIAAANWIATGNDLGDFASRLEKTNLPLICIGLGAQATISKNIPKLKEGTKRFLSLISDRSKSISVRGDFTHEVLNNYGIKNVMTTGCPSLLLTGSEGPSIKKIPTNDKLVCHGTRHAYKTSNEFQSYIYNQALELDSDILLQSEFPDIHLCLGSEIPQQHINSSVEALTKSYNSGDFSKIKSYLQNHGKFFTSYDNWIEYSQSRTFCVGTRIHGTIASLISGTPAILIAHDARTIELATAMNVPFILSTEIDINHPLPFDRLHNIFNSNKLTENYSIYRNHFLKFFEENNLCAN